MQFMQSLRRLSAGAFLGVAFATLSAAPAHALDILLTNDDGYSAIGIQTLRTALIDAGHDVTLVAPFANRSGSSAALNLAPVISVPVGPSQYGLQVLESLVAGGRAQVAATPATCVFFGLSVLLAGDPPDLVVSGTNIGSNVGTATPFSGTVGAATAGVSNALASIAVSTDPTTADTTDPEYAAHFADVAQFVVRLIAQLERTPGALHASGGLLPPGIGLNVNYPPLAPAQVRGVKLAVQGQTANVSLVYQPAPGGIFVPGVIPNPDPGDDVKDSDTAAFEDGFITIVPISNDLTAGPMRHQLHSVLHGLEP